MFTDANFDSQFLEDENQSSNIQKGNSWFRGSMGLSCNFISNNLVNLISLAFLAVKFFILNKIIVKRFLRKLGFLGFQEVRGLKILHIFTAEAISMSPFIIMPNFMIFLNMGVQGFGGKINLLFNLTLLLFVFSLPFISFCAIEIVSDQYASMMQRKEKKGGLKFLKNWRKLVKFNKAENRQNIWNFIETLAIPSAICFQNKLGFFIAITPLIIWKAIRFVRNREFLSKRDLFFRFQGVAIWVVYHFTFLYLYICQFIIKENRQSEGLNSSWKYAGFLILACLVVSGLLDIIYILIEIISWIK